MMNLIYLILTTLSLGGMILVSGMHYREVQQLVDKHSDPLAVDSSQEYKGKPVLKEKVSVENVKLNKSVSNTRESTLKEILIAIRKEQKNLRMQLSDTNRNLDELTFRVDSYSSQFRPLRTQIETPRAQVVSDGELLPPKR